MANFLWSIWRRKNDEIWENKDVPIEFVVRRGKEFHQSWKCAKTTKNPYKFEGYKLHHCCNLERILRLVSLIMKGAD